MEGLLITVLEKLNDPLLILNFIVIIGLFYLLLKKEKSIEGMQTCINNNMKEGVATSARLVTLVEGMVYGRDRNESNR